MNSKFLCCLPAVTRLRFLRFTWWILMKRFQPDKPEPVAAYEPADSFEFSPQPTQGRYGEPPEIGVHGLWPGHPDYRSVFVLWGPGIKARKTPEISMVEIYPRLKRILSLEH